MGRGGRKYTKETLTDVAGPRMKWREVDFSDGKSVNSFWMTMLYQFPVVPSVLL